MDCRKPLATPFLAYPREIRDMIYKYIVIAADAVTINSQVKEDNPALFRVCKKVHEEATEVFYKYNTFFIPQTFFRVGKPLQGVPVAKLLGGLNATRLRMIRKLDVEMPVCEDTLSVFSEKKKRSWQADLTWTDRVLRHQNQRSQGPRQIQDPGQNPRDVLRPTTTAPVHVRCEAESLRGRPGHLVWRSGGHWCPDGTSEYASDS